MPYHSLGGKKGGLERGDAGAQRKIKTQERSFWYTFINLIGFVRYKYNSPKFYKDFEGVFPDKFFHKMKAIFLKRTIAT